MDSYPNKRKNEDLTHGLGYYFGLLFQGLIIVFVILIMINWLSSLQQQSVTPPVELNAQQWFDKGLAAYSGRAYEDAIAAFDTSLAAGYDPYKIYPNRADAYFQLANYQAAIDDYEKLLKRKSNPLYQTQIMYAHHFLADHSATLSDLSKLVSGASKLPQIKQLTMDGGTHFINLTSDTSQIFNYAGDAGDVLNIHLEQAPDLLLITMDDRNRAVDYLLGDGTIEYTLPMKGEFHIVVITRPNTNAQGTLKVNVKHSLR
ncbi:hypothetical protein MASR2M15_08700 [Anaerolineales bacterium]